MSGLNKVCLIGNLGKDPEILDTSTGGKLAKFSIATSESWKDKTTGEKKETTEWHNIVVFSEPLVKVIEQYVKKGHKVYVEGKMKTRMYEKDGQKHYRTEVVMDPFSSSLVMLGGGGGGPRSDEYGAKSDDVPGAPDSRFAGQKQKTKQEMDDEIPF